jgi:glutamate 5-kinase
VRADLLIILSTVDGVLDANNKRIPYVDKVSDVLKFVSAEKGGNLSKGGMDSKLNAAQIATKTGCGVVIAGGRNANVLSDIMSGKDTGTLILSNAL